MLPPRFSAKDGTAGIRLAEARAALRNRASRRVSTAPEPPLVEAPSLGHRLGRVALWLGGLAVAAFLCQLLGIDLRGWISNLWDALSDVAVGYLVAGLALQTVQTTLTAIAWVGILRAAYPEAGIKAHRSQPTCIVALRANRRCSKR